MGVALGSCLVSLMRSMTPACVWCRSVERTSNVLGELGGTRDTAKRTLYLTLKHQRGTNRPEIPFLN